MSNNIFSCDSNVVTYIDIRTIKEFDEIRKILQQIHDLTIEQYKENIDVVRVVEHLSEIEQILNSLQNGWYELVEDIKKTIGRYER